MTKKPTRLLFIAVAILLTITAIGLLIISETTAKDPAWSHATGNDVQSVAISADGEYIVAGSQDYDVYLFHRDDSDPLWTYTTTDQVESVAISSSGGHMVAGADDTHFYLFEQGSADPLWNLSLDGEVNSVDIDADGDGIVVGTGWENRTYHFKRTSGSAPQWTYDSNDEVIAVAISGDGSYIITGSGGAEITLFDQASSTPEWSYTADDYVETVDISEDGEYMAAGSDGGMVYLFEKGSSTPLWSHETGDSVNSVAISADGEYIAAGSRDNKVYLFEQGSSSPLWSYETGDYIHSVAISADGGYITAGSNDDKVYLFKQESNEPCWTYRASDIGTVSISADGQSLAAGSDDWNVYFFTNEPPVAGIDDSLIDDPSEMGDSITLSGWVSTDDGSIEKYFWRSNEDGVLYHGADNEFFCDNLSLGYHVITLWVMDDYGVWSEPANAYVNITPPETVASDYDDGENPSIIISGDMQNNPSVYDGVVVWDEARYDGRDVFMFDLDDEDEVTMLSYPSSLLEDPDEYEVITQNAPLVHGDTAIWVYSSSREEGYQVYSYDLKKPDWGGEELFTIDDMPVKMMMSDRWIVWSAVDFGGPSILEPFALYSYNIQNQLQKKLFYFDGYFTLDGDRVMYKEDTGNIFSQESYLVAYDLLGETEVLNVTVYASSGDVYDMDLYEDYIVWEDHRLDDLFAGISNPDIYFINLDTQQEARLTFNDQQQVTPLVEGDYIVWSDSRGPSIGVYAYSISQNRTAVLSENQSEHSNLDLQGDHVVWTAGGQVFIYDLSTADWGDSGAVFVDLDKRQGGGGGGGGPFDDLLAINNYDLSGEERDEEAVGGFPVAALIYIVICVIPVVLGAFYAFRTNFKNMKVLAGLVLSIIMLILVVLVHGTIYKDSEDYDDWREDNPDVGDSIEVAGVINYEKEWTLGDPEGGDPVDVYTYGLEGSDYAFHSEEDIGDEGDYVYVEIELLASETIPILEVTIDLYQVTSDGSPHGWFILFTILNFVGLGLILFVFTMDHSQLSLFSLEREGGAGGKHLCTHCEGKLYFVDDYDAWYCDYCQDYREPRSREKKKKGKKKPAKKGAPKKKSRKPSCDSCGGTLDFIDQYDRWYCYTCAEYREPKTAPAGKKKEGGPAAKKSTATKCRQCRQPMNFIQEYDRWYCYTCNRYAEPQAAAAATAPAKAAKAGARKPAAKKAPAATPGRKKLRIKCSRCGKAGEIPATAKRPLKIKCSGCGNTKVIK